MRDIQTTTNTKLALAPQQVAAATQGLIVDGHGSASCCFEVFAGAIAAANGANFLTITVEHGDDPALADAGPVPAADLIIDGIPGDMASASIPLINDAAGQANGRITRLGYRGRKRYRRLVFAETGIVDAFLSAFALHGHLSKSPS